VKNRPQLIAVQLERLEDGMHNVENHLDRLPGEDLDRLPGEDLDREFPAQLRAFVRGNYVIAVRTLANDLRCTILAIHPQDEKTNGLDLLDAILEGTSLEPEGAYATVPASITPDVHGIERVAWAHGPRNQGYSYQSSPNGHWRGAT
jgi:hypothetical protein